MKICKVKGCGKKYSCNNYCSRHARQMSRYGKIFKRTIRDKNEIFDRGNYLEIALYRKNQIVNYHKFDKDDLLKVKQYKWHLTAQGYAATHLSKIKQILLHRLITNAPKNSEVDHRSLDRTDSRKQNLRIATKSLNMMNREKQRNNTSGYKGVYKHKSGHWYSRVILNYKVIRLGTFLTIQEAAEAYNEAAIKYYGKFARLNIIS